MQRNIKIGSQIEFMYRDKLISGEVTHITRHGIIHAMRPNRSTFYRIDYINGVYKCVDTNLLKEEAEARRIQSQAKLNKLGMFWGAKA